MIASPVGPCSACGEMAYKDCGGSVIPHKCAPALVAKLKISRSAVERILDEVECKPYELRVVTVGDGGMAIQARLWREDVELLSMGWGSGGKFYVSPWSTREEIVQKALGACLAYANHEVREHFLWRGRRIFGPHISHDRLWEIAEDTVQRK